LGDYDFYLLNRSEFDHILRDSSRQRLKTFYIFLFVVVINFVCYRGKLIAE
jgi:hypothetical protein